MRKFYESKYNFNKTNCDGKTNAKDNFDFAHICVNVLHLNEILMGAYTLAHADYIISTLVIDIKRL